MPVSTLQRGEGTDTGGCLVSSRVTPLPLQLQEGRKQRAALMSAQSQRSPGYMMTLQGTGSGWWPRGTGTPRSGGLPGDDSQHPAHRGLMCPCHARAHPSAELTRAPPKAPGNSPRRGSSPRSRARRGNKWKPPKSLPPFPASSLRPPPAPPRSLGAVREGSLGTCAAAAAMSR